MLAGGEAGNSCTGTWRRVHCRNSWQAEMVTRGETGNSCTGTWRRVHYRNSWQVEMVTGGETGIAVQVPGGEELHERSRYSHRGCRRATGGSPGDGCIVTLTGRGSWQGRWGFQGGIESVLGEGIASEIFSPDSDKNLFLTHKQFFTNFTESHIHRFTDCTPAIPITVPLHLITATFYQAGTFFGQRNLQKKR